MNSLKALAERARDARNGILDHPVGSDIWRELCARSRLAHEHFSVAASPAAVLALLEDLELARDEAKVNREVAAYWKSMAND